MRQNTNDVKIIMTDQNRKIIIHEVLPPEIFVKILKKLGYKSIGVARGTCQHWKKVIDSYELIKAAKGKLYKPGPSNLQFSHCESHTM